MSLKKIFMKFTYSSSCMKSMKLLQGLNSADIILVRVLYRYHAEGDGSLKYFVHGIINDEEFHPQEEGSG